jgi:hypothetical protein
MNVKYLLMAIALIAAGCNDSGKQQQENGASKTTGNGGAPKKAEKGKGNGFWQPLAWHEYRDNTGAVIASMPFPADWKVAKRTVQGEPSITGPNGIEISDFSLQSFMFSNDPNMQQIYRQSGQPLRAMPGMEQVIQEDIAPRLAEKGFRFVRQYEIPEVTKMDKWYSDQLYKAVPSQSEIAAIGSDWKTDDGKVYFVLLHLNMSTTAELQMWSYYCNGLSADAPYFEKAKKQLLFAFGNTHYPLEPIMAYNQREAAKAGISWAAHNQRMAESQANFQAQQRAFVNKSNAVNDAIMSGWKERNASSDKTQERTIDGIYERTNAVDPATGRKYKVAAGANNYWMNGDGEYISTDQQGYNPNLDDNMNAQRWQELQEVK